MMLDLTQTARTAAQYAFDYIHHNTPDIDYSLDDFDITQTAFIPDAALFEHLLIIRLSLTEPDESPDINLFCTIDSLDDDFPITRIDFECDTYHTIIRDTPKSTNYDPIT